MGNCRNWNIVKINLVNLRFLAKRPHKAFSNALAKTGPFRIIHATQNRTAPVTWGMYLAQRVVGINRQAYWPMHYTSRVSQPHRILVGFDSFPGYMPGGYIQGVGRIILGDAVRIGPNVGLISGNHLISDSRRYEDTKLIRLGNYCWIGMNSVILPGVTLGPYTIVGAGSVVTKSFSEGYQVIGGNPARTIRQLKPELCDHYLVERDYRGYIPAERFEDYRNRQLDV